MKENKHTILTPDVIATLTESERKNHIIRLLKSVPLTIKAKTFFSNLLNSFVVLELSYNNIGTIEAADIAKALEKNNTITTLDLNENDIGNEGAKYIAEALEKSNTITTLHLASNNIGNEGAQYIAEVLEKNNTVTTLDLGENNIGNEGVKHIAEALKKNNTVTTLELYLNEIKVKGAKEIAKALEKNNTIKTLDLSLNNIKDAGAKYIAKALEKNNTITTLHLRNNWIKAVGEKEIAKAVNINRSHLVENLFNIALTLLSMDIPTELKGKIFYGSTQYQDLHHFINEHFNHNDNKKTQDHILEAMESLYKSHKKALLKPLVKALDAEKEAAEAIFRDLASDDSALSQDITTVKTFLPDNTQTKLDDILTRTKAKLSTSRKEGDGAYLKSIIESVEKVANYRSRYTNPPSYSKKIQEERDHVPTRGQNLCIIL